MILSIFQATKKWRSLKSTTKAKEAERQKERKKTGGGESAAVEPSRIELKVLSIIGPTIATGIPGGVDSGVAAEAGNVEDGVGMPNLWVFFILISIRMS